MSYPYGKQEVCEWIRENYPDAVILDVGAGDGTWKKLLPEYTMDAIEIYKPAAARLEGYRNVEVKDVATYKYRRKYDLIIFGDVLEHMTVDDVQKALKHAESHCEDMIIAVPWMYEQGEVDGNKWQRHIQDDLTPELFEERYPGFEVLWQNELYAYYHKA